MSKVAVIFALAAHAQWADLGFQGKLEMIDPRTGPAVYLQATPACRKDVEKTVRWVNEYAYAAAHAEPGVRNDPEAKKAASAWGEIKKLQNGPCREYVNRAYAVTSLSALYGYGWKYRKKEHIGLIANLPPALYSGLIGAFLANQGKVEFGPMGMLNDKPVLGTYRCETSMIRLDPSMPPLDLAAHFIHEIDHLLRDKFPAPPSKPFDEASLMKDAQLVMRELLSEEDAILFETEWRKTYLEQIAPLRDIAALMMEESLAALQTSFRQVSLAQATHGSKDRPSYGIEGDLTLFSRKGPLQKLWTQDGMTPYDHVLGQFLGDRWGIAVSSSGPEESIFRDFYREFLRARANRIKEVYRRFLDLDWRVVWPKMDPEVLEVHRRVFNVYFPGRTFDDRAEKFLSRQYWSYKTDPLYSRQVEVVEKVEERIDNATPSADYELVGMSVDRKRTQATIELTLADLAELKPLLLEASPSCKDFLKAAKEGRLAPYIGAGDPQRPEGGGGIRPEGGGGIRPCVRLSESL